MSASAPTTIEIAEFVNGYLVSWLESCLPFPEVLTGYQSLLDSSIIHTVWLQIDPEPKHHPSEINELAVGASGLAAARAKNFVIIIRNLKSFYEEELGQTLLVLPNAYALGYHPESRHGLEQMKILLTLLLGAAVKCPNNGMFIEKIKELDVNTQHAIMEAIKLVSQSYVLTEEAIGSLPSATLYQQIVNLTKERDDFYMTRVNSLCAEQTLNAQCRVDGPGSLPMSPSSGISNITSSSSTSNSEANHMAVELADLKSKLRKLRQELEEKIESQSELREELEHKTAQYEKLRKESQEWHAEAKRAAAYRDENDILRERAERADHLEREIQKYQEKMTDADFYKNCVEQLREDMQLLVETKDILEDELKDARKRSEQMMMLESEIIKYKKIYNDMALERDMDRSKLEQLIEENSQLQLVAKNMSMTHDYDKSMIDSDDECNSGDNSLSEQLTNNALSKVLKLELENRHLMSAIEKMKESSFHESTNKILDLEKEKKRLQLKVDNLNEKVDRMANENAELETVFKNALEENKKLQDTIDDRKRLYDRQSTEREAKLLDLEKQVESLNKEKQRVQNLNERIQRRADDSERLVASQTKEIEQLMDKCKKADEVKEQLYDLQAKHSVIERENVGLLKEVNKLKESLEAKSVQLDESITSLETKAKELQKLSKAVEEKEQLQQKLLEMEKQNQELVSQREIDLETITRLQNDLVSGTLATNKVRHNFEKLGITVDENEDTNDFNVETVVEKLVRNPETFKTVREIMLNVSREHDQQYAKSQMCVVCHRKEIYRVEKNIELSPAEAQELNFEHKVSRVNKNQKFSTERNELITVLDNRDSQTRDELAEERNREAPRSRDWDKDASLNLKDLNEAKLQIGNEQLQVENARLQVDVATLSSQITSLNAQHATLQLGNTQLSNDKDMLMKQLSDLKFTHKSTLKDLVNLQKLHSELSLEYDKQNELKEQQKAVIRDLRNETREQKSRIICLEAEIEELTKQNATLNCQADLNTLHADYTKLTEDFHTLYTTNINLTSQYKLLQDQHKTVRAENSKLKLQNTKLSGESNAKSDQLKSLEFEYNVVVQRCESLLQVNADLDTDRKTLMDNVSKLLSQYHELLSHSLEDKQHFHEEEKNYAERLHNLSRQKEKLEEKIMEQYKQFAHNAPKKKPFASSFVRRVKKASSEFINKSRRSWVDDSRLAQSQFIIGSESGGNDSDNSVEEPHSIATDTLLLQRNIPMRQSLQRLEAPDVTGSSLTLGTAGSRRTVYLIDENQKLPDPNAHSSASASASGAAKVAGTVSATTAATTSASATNSNSLPSISNTPATSSTGSSASASGNGPAEPQTPTQTPILDNNKNNGHSSSSNSNSSRSKVGESPAPTFLMYNRIHTTIGGNAGSSSGPMSLPNLDQNNLPASMTSSTHSNNANSTAAGNTTGAHDDKALRKRNGDSLWYEYGCV